MPGSEETVKVGIETSVKGEAKLDRYADSLERLENVKLDGLSKAEARVSSLATRLKAASDAAKSLRRDMEGIGSGRAGGGLDKQAAAAARAQVAADRLAQAQKRVSVAATELEARQGRVAVALDRNSNAKRRAEQESRRLELAERRLTQQTEDFERRLSRVNFSKFSGQLNSVGQGVRNVGQSLTVGVTAPVVALGTGVLTAAVRMDSLKRGLTAVAGSSQEAETQLTRLRKIAEQPGLGFTEAIQGSIRLQAVGFNASTAERALKTFGNAIALTGGGAPELDRVTVQLGQLASKGKVLTQDLRPIIEASPAVGAALKKAFGTVNAQDIEKLGLSTEVFLNRLMDGLEELPKADVNAVSNQLENLKTAAFLAAESVGRSLLPSLVTLVKTAEPLLNRFAAFWSSLSPQIQQFILIVTGLAAALGPVLFIVGSLITSITGIISFGGALAGMFGTISGAVGVVTGAVSSLVAAIGAGGLAGGLTAIGGAISGVVLPALAAAAVAAAKFIAIAAAIIAIVAVVAAAVGAAAYVLYQVWTRNIGGIQETTAKAFAAVKAFVFSALEAIRAEWNKILPLLRTLLETVLNGIARFWAQWGETIVAVVTKAFNVVRTVVLSAIQIIGGIIRLVLAVINGDWSAAWQAAKDIVNAAIRAVVTAISAFYGIVWTILKGIVSAIISAAVAAAKAAYNLAVRVITAIIDFIKNSPAYIVAALKYLFTQAVADVSAFVYRKGAELWSYVLSGFTGAQAAQPLTVAPPAAPTEAAPEQPAPPAPERPNAFGSPAGTGKKARAVREPVRPIEAAARADEARRLENTKDANERLLRANETAYSQELITFSQFLGRRIALEQASINLEIEARREAGNRIISNLAELNGRLARSKGAERNAVRREIDEQTADLIKLDGEITRLRGALADVTTKAEAESIARLKESERAARETTQRYLELTNQKAAAARVGLGLEFDDRQAALARDLRAAQETQARARKAGNAEAVAGLQSEIDRLQTQIAQTAEIRRQAELAADFEQTQTDLSEIERRRSLALDALNRKLEETGATEDDATKARRALMESYKAEIDKVVAALERLRAAGLASPEVLKIIDALRSGQADAASIPLDERANAAQRALERIRSERDRALSANDDRPGTALEHESRRLAILNEFNAKLREQLAIWGAIEATRAGGPSDAFKDAQADVSRATEKVIDFRAALRGTAAEAAVSGVINFFTDLASGAKGFKDAALDALGSFVRVIQQIIVQILALKLIELITGIPVGALLKMTGGGLKDGGAASSLPARTGRFADGGAPGGDRLGNVRINPAGYMRGPGGPRSDSIPVYFPAARRLGRVSATEYVFDAETTRNIGVERLEALRREKGRNFDSMFFDRLAGHRSAVRLAEGGAAAGALAGVSGAPEFSAGDTNIDLQQLNVIERKPIEEIISDHALSSAGDRLFVNQMTRNLSTIRTKLGIKG